MITPETADEWAILMAHWRRPPRLLHPRLNCLTKWPPFMPSPRIPKPVAVLALIAPVQPYTYGARIAFVDG